LQLAFRQSAVCPCMGAILMGVGVQTSINKNNAQATKVFF